MAADGKFKRVTRADVARHAGVSETIVSYVVNNNRYVHKDKRKRVEQAIKELHYRPNTIARALKGKSSNHFIFIADQITNEHFSQLISEMDRNAYDKGYFISLCANRNNKEFVSEIISRQYDGVIISSISFPGAYIRELLEANMPVVLLVNRDYKGMDEAGKIHTGLEQGAALGVNHLADKGRKNIVYLDRFSANGHFSTMDDLRLRGVVTQMKARGLPFTKANIITGASSAGEVAQKLRAYIEAGNPVDAIFGRNDRLACIGMQTVQQMGYTVPDDIAVIGFDNSSLSQYTTPTLTTIAMPRDKIGKAAVEMLHHMIEEGEVPPEQSFTTELIERQST